MNARAGSRPRPVRRSRHLEHADLVGRSEPVLVRSQQSQAGGSLALERQHGVDEVLERLRSGEPPLLGDVADEDDRDALALRELRQPQRRFAHLPDAARRSVELARPSRSGSSPRSSSAGRLVARDLDHPRRSRSRRRRAGRAGRPAGRAGARAGGPGRSIPRRWRRARRRPAAATPAASLEQQRRLADARLAADQHDRPRDQPAAEHPVDLADAVCSRGTCRRVAERRRCRSRRRPPSATARARLVPRRWSRRGCSTPPQVAALALPAQEDRGAGLADVSALRLGHGGRSSVTTARLRRRRDRLGSSVAGSGVFSSSGGSRGPPRGPCRPRPSCPARTG